MERKFLPLPNFSSYLENFGKCFPKLFLPLYLVVFTLKKLPETFSCLISGEKRNMGAGGWKRNHLFEIAL
jgi:hypothetical protein